MKSPSDSKYVWVNELVRDLPFALGKRARSLEGLVSSFSTFKTYKAFVKSPIMMNINSMNGRIPKIVLLIKRMKKAGRLKILI